MASTILVFIFPIIFIMGDAESFVSMKCKTSLAVQSGQEALLECVLKTSEEVEDLKIRNVIWKKNGETLLNFDEVDTTKKPGYSFAEPYWNNSNVNVSLLISSTTVQHRGTYSCQVNTNNGPANGKVPLKVTAKYKAPTVRFISGKTAPNMEDTLLCTSGGGYPQGQLRWFDVHNQEWMGSAKMEASEMEDGLFELSSRLTLLSGSTFSKYTCAVFNDKGDRENEFTFDTAETTTVKPRNDEVFGDKPTPVYNVVAPVVVIGSLVVGLLLTLIIYKCKRKRDFQRHSVVSEVEYETEGDLEQKKALEDDMV